METASDRTLHKKTTTWSFFAFLQPPNSGLSAVFSILDR